jgi:phage shock protein C
MFNIAGFLTHYGGSMAEIPTPNHRGPSGGLYRSRTDRMILGVCGGIAKHYNMDPTLVRVLMFLFTLTVIGLLGYIVIGLIIPEEP